MIEDQGNCLGELCDKGPPQWSDCQYIICGRQLLTSTSLRFRPNIFNLERGRWTGDCSGTVVEFHFLKKPSMIVRVFTEPEIVTMDFCTKSLVEF